MKNLKGGDKVVMHNCYEASFNKDKVFTCREDSFISSSGDEVVFLNGVSGYFCCRFLKSA
ncbi:hypothetical protein Harreka1_66 [Olleya phage Harreka_1]|uniref:Uncharacterized protein n=1 Tax=Olleya phage Harreka_1 TaxID=2745673 RepID=A0A8E5E9H9_9CAUD|nr:hypothetical protein M1M26_gp66 [Olleya phage Harreka_1]QQV90473.1 hypothetical protein Harreka1_66 [Olleya phage Harreka_1]